MKLACQIIAPAKVNLCLAITGRTDNGYHQMVSLAGFTAFGDKLTITPAERTTITVAGPFANHLNKAGGETLLRDALALYHATTNTNQPFHIHLDKQIPIGGGLGGGSADAGALLRALSQDDKAEIQAELLTKSVALGADVPACLSSQMHIMMAIGQDAHHVTIPDNLPAIILVNPRRHADTKSVFQAYQASQTPFSDCNPVLIASLLAAGQWHKLIAIGNDLRKPAQQLYPEIAKMLDDMADHYQAICQKPAIIGMTGSGASAFALCDNADHAKMLSQALIEAGYWAVNSQLIAVPPATKTAF
ncbi:MAG: 4-(cytidine 5'-diphospho)-2-C-methyl-D-erythritol kinase [Candidatus Puniceispirillaceae bacterium]